MIPKDSILRVARPTDKLKELAQMYVDGLGFTVLSEFSDHAGFDGVILGHPHHAYHLEFTHHRGMKAGGAPTLDNLLVFYVPHRDSWERCCSSMIAAGFKEVPAYNKFWNQQRRTFEDVDNYRVVIQNGTWDK